MLKVAFEGYLRLDNFDFERLKDMLREEALRSFVHQQLRPLLARDQMSRYIRIFAWGDVWSQQGADQFRQDAPC